MSLDWQFRAALDRVIDGDTVVMHLDLGFRVYTKVSVRLADVSAPELRGAEKARGLEAKGIVENWFKDHEAKGREFIVSTRRDRRSFNRYIGDVTPTRGPRQPGRGSAVGLPLGEYLLRRSDLFRR